MNIEEKFYQFRRGCKKGVLINNKHVIDILTVKELIDNLVETLIEVSENKWIVITTENIFGSDTIYIEKI